MDDQPMKQVMGPGSEKLSTFFLLVLCSLCVKIVTSANVITSAEFIKDPEVIVSNNNIFKLGFFTLRNSTNRYAGIWYNKVPVVTAIWVANRDKPLRDSSGVFTISEDGNLVVVNEKNEILWSTNVSGSASNSSAQLSDNGNLVLRDGNSGAIIWESFQHPCDTLLPEMKLSADRRTGKKLLLRSWKSSSDPSIGSVTVGLSARNLPEIFVWKDNDPIFRSGPWNGRIFIGVPEMESVNVDGINIVDDREGIVYLSFSFANETYLSDFVVGSTGKFFQTYWEDWMNDRNLKWRVPGLECEYYGKCGVFGSCNVQRSPICSCLRGFEPKIAEEWNIGNWSSGCVRKKQLQCERINIGGETGKEDGFLKLADMKVPDCAELSSLTADRCREECLANCSCVAYSYYTDIGCMTWTGDLIDTQNLSRGGADLYVRVAFSELDQNKRQKMTIIIAAGTTGAVAIAIVSFLSWRLMSGHRGREGERKKKLFFSAEKGKMHEIPIFKLQELKTATNNFHEANKLGQGGFGPVYKGKLHDGKEIAVKRLSRASGQGIEEFMNEIAVISKLQHRNLVRLFGCCVEGEETMLVYEHMSNKSLDAYLFDPQKQKLLDWRTRFGIVEGISRGLLYLHRDSRLKIIHRDLKASNILLDGNLNPKISDFGMARIFGGSEDQAKTRRVVGTYGYMSPEYAIAGRFSEKSDVFSFGVLLLEIVSGRRNTDFHNDEQAFCLLGYVWKLWIEGRITSLIDPVIPGQCCHKEILRCIHVGLLCVQELANDRPNMPTVISMLNSEIVDLPSPKQPAFTERQSLLDTKRSQLSSPRHSRNNLTITSITGR